MALNVDAAGGIVAVTVVVAGVIVTVGVMVVVVLGCSLADWQPVSKNTASAEISDPPDQKVRLLAWFIFSLYFLYLGFTAVFRNVAVPAIQRQAKIWRGQI
jgi:hypothetical protein